MILRFLAWLARAVALFDRRVRTLSLSLLVVLACARDEAPVTQVLLTVDADPEVVAQLTAIDVATYPADVVGNSAAPGPSDVHRFVVAVDQRQHVKVPFSLGIDKREADRFLLVVTGYRGEHMLIERKLRVSFIAAQTRPVEIELVQGCLGQLCGDASTSAWLTQSCDPEREHVCAPIAVQEVDAADASAESTLPGTGLEAGAPRVDAGGPNQPNDAGAAKSDASISESDPCAKSPCGKGNTCKRAGADYQCACGAEAFQADAKRCVPKFTAVSVGDSHACALRSDGTVACWGSNQWGQLGSDSPVRNSKPIPVPGLNDAIAVSAGTENTCAIRADRSVACWGANEWGELGNGTTTPSLAPVAVTGLRNVAQISVQWTNACARTMDGAVSCWGANDYNVLQLGEEPMTLLSRPKIQNLPITIPGISNVSEVEVGFGTLCTRSTSAGTTCWGANPYGQIGDGRPISESAPARVVGLDAVEISLGANVHCARKADGSVLCAGSNEFGQLGNGTKVDSNVFVPVVGLSNVVEISAGLSYACARKADGSVACWGMLVSGDLNSAATTPVPIAGVSDAVQIGTGQVLGCALKKDGSIMCWGNNFQGQLGDGSDSKASAVPVTVLAY